MYNVTESFENTNKIQEGAVTADKIKEPLIQGEGRGSVAAQYHPGHLTWLQLLVPEKINI